MSLAPCSVIRESATGTAHVSFQQQSGKTTVDQQSCSGLLRVSRPVYRGASTSPEIQLIHLGPGCMNEDTYVQQLVVGQKARAVVGYQSYSKILPGATGSTMHTVIKLEEGSQLLLKPNVVIPFKDARYAATTQVHLADGASVALSDILVSRQDTPSDWLLFTQVALTLHVYRATKMIMRDCIQVGLQSLGRGRVWSKEFPVIGSYYLLGDVSRQLEQALLQSANSISSKEVRVGVSFFEHAGFVIRILAKRVQLAEQVIEAVTELSCAVKSVT